MGTKRKKGFIMSQTPHILICDDDPIVHESLKLYLDNEHYTHSDAFDGEESIKLAHDASPDLILLDVMLPKLSGFEVLQQVREFSDVPIIMLTARGDDMDKILGLDFGADDYVTKPFNPLEVKGRIKAILRRTSRARKAEAPVENIIEVGDLRMDLDNRRVTLSGKEINLTSKEFEMLELLATHPGKVYSRVMLLQMVWGKEYQSPGDVRTVDVHIRRLREKIEHNASDPQYVLTKWKLGYYFKSHEK